MARNCVPFLWRKGFLRLSPLSPSAAGPLSPSAAPFATRQTCPASSHCREIHVPPRQHSLPAAYYRGGTSRAVFFRREHLPADRERWDPIFRGVIGCPDPYGRELDGMGGGISSLSKVCVVGPSARPDADVDYTFAALGIRDGQVDYTSNCGNMSSAVGPYAVDQGLLPVPTTTTTTTSTPSCSSSHDATVRIHNTNTGKIIHATFPLAADGEAAAAGDFRIDGVAGTGARVRLDFVDPAGSRTGKLLPTGNTTDVLNLGGGEGGGGDLRVTCIDVGNPCCFVTARELGVDGRLTPDEIDARADLMRTLEAVRRRAAVRMGLAANVDDVPGSVPKIAFVSPMGDAERESSGTSARAGVVARALSVGQPHKAIPITVALAVAAAARLPGTVVHECLRGDDDHDGAAQDGAAGDELDVYHASGRLTVDAKFDSSGKLLVATVFRTARRLMEGLVFWK
ncbi:hypothetical protein VTK73DRAFT_10260 [Phialemonium thermophilum]|uniref:DUF453-domain-containing protein n=1 Tax=Phialemonium thermophilum TaxID=223376 RepID=A0ABR3VXN0_9PEZI